MNVSYAGARSVTADLSPQDYLDLFPDIAVELDRERFRAQGWPVSTKVIENAHELDRCYSAFRLSLGRFNPRLLHWVLARQALIGEVAPQIDRLPPANQARLAPFLEDYAGRFGPVCLTLPAYGLPRGRLFVLDGNHRLTALRHLGCPFEVAFLVIDGPPDPTVVPDIAKCQGAVRRSVRSYFG
jgi:hypothetical protein